MLRIFYRSEVWGMDLGVWQLRARWDECHWPPFVAREGGVCFLFFGPFEISGHELGK